jgi:Ni/Fe-hydrogenase subunit HybB-like protein
LIWPAVVLALLATSYTAFLFAQGLARDLWQGPYAAADLVAQSIIEGAAVLMLLAPFIAADGAAYAVLKAALLAGIVLHLLLLASEHLTPSPTVHHRLALRAIVHGAYARLYWIGAIIIGGALPLVLLPLTTWEHTSGLSFNGALATAALAGAFAWEYIWVEAGQSVPNS